MRMRFIGVAICGIGLALSACNTDPGVLTDINEMLQGSPEDIGTYNQPSDREQPSGMPASHYTPTPTPDSRDDPASVP